MRRSGFSIMSSLIELVKPMWTVMLLCITLGTLGFLAAIAITVLAVNLLLTVGGNSLFEMSFLVGAIIMLVCAILRAVLRYGEQTCGHYIAFKLLAIIRDQIFTVLRQLAPAKLEGKEKGNLISLITTDIELLEVFYAHTIAPIAIAFVVSLIMTFLIGSINIVLGLFALISFIVVGVVIPIISSKIGRTAGMEMRNKMGELNSYFLESIRGIREVIQYDQAESRAKEVLEKTQELNELNGTIKKNEGVAMGLSGATVMGLTSIMLFLGIILNLEFNQILLSTVMLSASFGPVLALANLSATLNSTLACGERVLNLLAEKPIVVENTDGETPKYNGVKVNDLSFSYNEEKVLKNLNLTFEKNEIVSITGKSGSGKSTLLKLLMRFWNAEKESIKISDVNVDEITTSHLRKIESYMIQDTDLFKTTVANNIRIGKLNASMKEIMEACKKASIHDFIMHLPKGYNTEVKELGDSLSSGEKQRIGLARAFIHDADLLLLDEPTSNLDSLNEAIILKALKEEKENKTIVLVSHRTSTNAIADKSFTVESGRLS